MYLSGRPLHAVTANLAATLAEEFGGDLPLSFAGGADCFNVADLLGARPAHRHGLLATCSSRAATCACSSTPRTWTPPSTPSARTTPTTSSAGRRWRAGSRATAARRRRLRAVQPAPLRRRGPSATGATGRTRSGRTAPRRPARWAPSTASRRPASTSARSTSRCPATWPRCAPGTSAEAVRITRLDNPLPAILGRVCDHLCENTCIRTHLDQPLAIRQIKRFIMEQEAEAGGRGRPAPPRPGRPGWRSSGPGRPAWRPPSGWPTPASASRSSRSTRTPAAWSAGRSRPTACRRRRSTRTSPSSSASASRSATACAAGVDVTLDALRADGFAAIFVAVGAQRAKRLGLPGEDAAGRDRRRGLPARRAGGPAGRDRGARGRRRRRRHRHGLRAVGPPRGRLVRVAHLPPDGRPDAGRPGGDPRHPRGGHRDRRAGAAGRPPRRGRQRWPGLVVHPDRVPRRARRRRPQGAPRRPGLRVRDRPGHPHPGDQPARRCSTSSATGRRT